MLRNVGVACRVACVTHLCRLMMRWVCMREGEDERSVVQVGRYSRGGRRAGLSKRITRLMAGASKAGRQSGAMP